MKKALYILFILFTITFIAGAFYFTLKGDDEEEVGQKKLDNPLLFLDEVDLLPEYVQYGAMLSEQDLRIVMHEMSHQKVVAEEMWEKRLMDPELIEALYLMLNNHKYYNEDIYIEILTEWREGKFENAVEHHNTLWRLLDGDVGKAIRLATPEEEALYIRIVEQEQKKRH